MTEQVVKDVTDSLVVETDQQHNDFKEAANGFDGTPQTLGNIPARIIGRWQEEQATKSEELQAELSAGLFRKFLKEFRYHWWTSLINMNAPLTLIPCIWMAAVMVCWLIGSMVFGLAQLLVVYIYGEPIAVGLFLIASIITPNSLLFIGLPLFRAMKKMEDLRKSLEETEIGIDTKITSLVQDPVFLVTEVRNHIEHVQQNYRQKFVEVKGQFEIACREPRLEIDRELRKLRADRKELESLTIEEFPERDELLSIVQSEIDACKQLRKEASSKEKTLAESLKKIDFNITQFEQNLIVLDELKENYEAREQRLAKFDRYKKDSEKWTSLLESKRQRQLREIEAAVQELDQEIAGTQFALSEVVTKLPGGTTALRLEEFRARQLEE